MTPNLPLTTRGCWFKPIHALLVQKKCKPSLIAQSLAQRSISLTRFEQVLCLKTAFDGNEFGRNLSLAPLEALSQKRLSSGLTSSNYQSRLNLNLASANIVLFKNLGHTLGYGLDTGVTQRFNFFAHPGR